MSILIRGMEMPKSCSECRFFVDAWCYAFKADDWRNAYNKPPNGERLDNCPLVPVPPHGDLIDRDALMRHKGDCYDANGHLLYAVGTGNILCAPTIIPAEEGE